MKDHDLAGARWRTAYFCSPGCKRDFDHDPKKFIGRDEPPAHQHHA
jgi:hypothetical protein